VRLNRHAALLCSALAPLTGLHAETLIRPPLDVDVVGAIRSVKANPEETLLDIARRFDIGQDEILHANPDVDRWLPQAGAQVVLPTRHILPDARREGVILNVAEMRLYYFPPSKPGQPDELQTYPVSVGRMDWDTPQGTTRVVAKTRNPEWRPPESIKQEHAADGETLPDVIPAGPDNPLGKYALRLGLPGYLIHSTNKPYGVGMRVTHGCVRMYPEDIEVLFPQVPVGTPVQIVNQPVKLGWLSDTLFIEIHPPLEEDRDRIDLPTLTMDMVNKAWEKRPFVLDGGALNRAIADRNGIPVAIAHAARD
jgi:L,D-transpeptidase ErfK/SrfK